MAQTLNLDLSWNQAEILSIGQLLDETRCHLVSLSLLIKQNRLISIVSKPIKVVVVVIVIVVVVLIKKNCGPK